MDSGHHSPPCLIRLLESQAFAASAMIAFSVGSRSDHQRTGSMPSGFCFIRVFRGSRIENLRSESNWPS